MEEQNKNFTREDEQAMLAAILENTRKTKQYIKWQLIITVAMVVIPLLAMVFIIPIIFSQLSSVYGAGGLLQ
jgi:hypothetical protein